jgi:hypothetical protein
MEDLGHGEQERREEACVHLVVPADQLPHRQVGLVGGQPADADHAGADQIGMGAGRGPNEESVLEEVELHRIAVEADLRIAGGSDVGVAVTDQGGQSRQLHDHLVAREPGELAVERRDGAVELLPAEGVEEILVPAGQLAREKGEILPPLADGVGIGRGDGEPDIGPGGLDCQRGDERHDER